MVVDLLVDEMVVRAGVPSLLRDRARGVVHDLIASKVKAAVDQSVPAALKPDSELMRKLGDGAGQHRGEIHHRCRLPVGAPAT